MPKTVKTVTTPEAIIIYIAGVLTGIILLAILIGSPR